ncbi:MAG: MFS transporter [Clostridia bacterium]|nr:MFS transporter [Clostridia bacterium]
MENEKKKLWNPFSKEAEEGNVPNRELLSYSAALMGQNLTYGIVNGWLFYFCTDILHISPDKVGYLTGFSRIWDGINDPIVGTLIDRRKTKPGQKLHPYLGKLPIIVGLLTALLFIDFGVSETVSLCIILAIYLAWDFTYSFQDVALWGMMALISPHAKERERVSQWLNIGVGAAGIFTGLIPMVIGAKEALGVSEKTLFVFFGIFFGFIGELISSLAYKTKERVAYIPKENQQSLLKDIAELRHNKILLLLLLSQLLDFIGGAISQIYFFKYCVTVEVAGKVINGETVQTVFGFLVGALGSVSMFFAVKLANKIGGMRKTVILAQTMNTVVRIIAFFIGFDTIPQMLACAALLAVAAIPSNMIGIAQRAILCDAIEYAEWKTGKRTEGISNSMQNLTNKVKDALKLITSGLVLTALHYDARLGIDGQSEAFYKAQWPIFILLPALGSILYLIPFLCIRYSNETKAQVESDLKARRAAAEAETETA